MGIVYFEADTLQWQTLAKTWITKCNRKWMNECKTFLWDIFEWILPPVCQIYEKIYINKLMMKFFLCFLQMIDFVTKSVMHVIDPLKYNLINTTFDIIQMTIDDAVSSNTDDFHKFLISWTQAAVIYGITWGLGGLLNDESRKQFDYFHRQVISI